MAKAEIKLSVLDVPADAIITSEVNSELLDGR